MQFTCLDIHVFINIYNKHIVRIHFLMNNINFFLGSGQYYREEGRDYQTAQRTG